MNPELQAYFSDLVRDRIQELYDDPCAHDDASLRELHEEISLMRAAAAELQLDFNTVVREETSPYEQVRMDVLLRHSTWTDSIWDEVDAAEDELEDF